MWDQRKYCLISLNWNGLFRHITIHRIYYELYFLWCKSILYCNGNIMFNSNSNSSVILHIINCNMFLFSIIRDAEHMQSSCTFRNCLFMLKHYTSVKRPKVNSMFLVLRQKLRDHLQGSLNIFFDESEIHNILSFILY